MKGVRKASIAIGFSGLAAFAAGAEAASIPAGPYVGLVAGYQSTNLERTDKLDGDLLAKVDSLALEGARAGLIAGWSAWSRGMYGALEVNAGTSTAEGSIRSNGGEQKYKSKETYGAALLFGHRIVPGTLLYGRVGWQQIKGSAKFNGESDDEWFSGVRAGAGGMWALSDVVTFRLEYTHGFYQSEKWDHPNGLIVKLTPRENVFQGGFTVGF